jgi:hypothetical protein
VLQCAQGHSFEAWFGSQDDYDSQRARGLVTCPVCNDSTILKKLSAPRLNLGHGAAPDAVVPPVGFQELGVSRSNLPSNAPILEAGHGNVQHIQAAMTKMVHHVMANTEDVGPQFAEEARKIHYGEAPERGIRGQTSAREARELIEEGIGVLPFALPEALKGPLQ